MASSIFQQIQDASINAGSVGVLFGNVKSNYRQVSVEMKFGKDVAVVTFYRREIMKNEPYFVHDSLLKAIDGIRRG